MATQPPSNVERDRAQSTNDEARVTRPLRVVTLPAPDQRVYRTAGLKGGPKIDLTAADRLDEPPPEAVRADTGRSSFYAIAAKDVDDLETPVFRASEDGRDEAITLFTVWQDAQRFIHAAGWDKTHEVRPLGPDTLHDWLKSAQNQGLRYAAVNLDPTHHLNGEPQPVLFLGDLPEEAVAEWVQRQIALIR